MVASPFGVKLMDPEAITDYMDTLTIESAANESLPLVIKNEEP